MRNMISPSILAADFGILGKQIGEVEKAGADYLHIDVMDGVFVPAISFGMPLIKSIRGESSLPFDVHLMITKPERYIEEFANCGADIITFHLEATDNPDEVIRSIRKCGKKIGISLRPSTPISSVIPYLADIDMLLVMTVEPGFGGQEYIDSSTAKIKEAYSEIAKRNLSVDIEVDGGITADNVSVVLEAGANVIVTGSAVFSGDIEKNISEFKKHF